MLQNAANSDRSLQLTAAHDALESLEYSCADLERQNATLRKEKEDVQHQLLREKWTSVSYNWSEMMRVFLPDVSIGTDFADIQKLYLATSQCFEETEVLDCVVAWFAQNTAVHGQWVCLKKAISQVQGQSQQPLEGGGACPKCVEVQVMPLGVSEGISMTLRWAPQT